MDIMNMDDSVDLERSKLHYDTESDYGVDKSEMNLLDCAMQVEK